MQSWSCEKPPGPGPEGDLTVLCDELFLCLLRSTDIIIEYLMFGPKTLLYSFGGYLHDLMQATE